MLFLGGWSLNPATGWDLPVAGAWWMGIIQLVVVVAKMSILIAFAMAIRWTIPRFRFDQLMRLAWEGMIPTALFLLVVVSFFVFFGWQEWMWGGSLGTIAVIYLLSPLMPRQSDPNHKVPLAGSRFSPLGTDSALDSAGEAN